MKTKFAATATMMIAVLFAATANAQTGQQADVQSRVAPAYQPPGQPQPAPNRYYFGMNVTLIRGYGGTTLRVSSVAPGSPAYRAGLECGDEIRTVNGRRFDNARDSYEAVYLMNQFVDFAGGSAPAAAAAAPGNAQAYIAPGQYPPPQPQAYMIVRNVRNGQNVAVNVYPQRRGWAGPGPVAAAAAPMANR